MLRGPWPPYGFAYTEDGDGLLVESERMAIVRDVFRMIGGEGLTMGETQRRLNRSGVPSPMAEDRRRWKEKNSGLWSVSTLRKMVLNPLYRPLTVEEVAASGMVSPEAVRPLDPAKRALRALGLEPGSAGRGQPGRPLGLRSDPARGRGATKGDERCGQGADRGGGNGVPPRPSRTGSGSYPAGSSGAASAAASSPRRPARGPAAGRDPTPGTRVARGGTTVPGTARTGPCTGRRS